MDEIAKKYMVYVLLSPVRTVRNFVVGIRTVKRIRPNTLLVASAALFLFSLVLDFSNIVRFAAFVGIVVSWGFKIWVVGDWRNQKPF